MSTFLKSIVGACLILVITVCAGLTANKLFGSAQVGDLTEQKIYTLSDGTKSIVSKLNRKVTLKFFYTLSAARKLPEDARWLNNYYLYVKDLLAEYEKLGNGNVEVKFLDPKRYSDEEEEARKYDIRFYEGARPLCLGLVAETEFGKSKVLPQLHPMRQQFLEYEITKSIADLIERDKRKIGVISSVAMMGDDMNDFMRMMMIQQGRQPAQAWGIVRYLRTSYDVEAVEIGNDGKVPENIDYLMVVQPKDLDQKTLFAIDQYAVGGGNLMVFTDPFAYSDRPPQPQGMGMPPPPHTPGSNLNDLLKTWGVTMATDRVVTDRALVINDYPLFLQFRGETAEDQDGCFNKSLPFSQELKEFRTLGAGALTIDDKAAGTVTPIISTTTTGSTWKPKTMSAIGNTPPDTMKEEIADGTQSVVVACVINGPITSSFPDGIEIAPTPGKDGKSVAPPTKLEAIKAAKEAKVLVIADVDAISDILCIRYDPRNPNYYRAESRNIELIESALDYLGGDTDLLKVRSRASVIKRFETYDAMDRAAAKKTGEKEKEIKEQIQKAQDELKKLQVSSMEELRNELATKQKALNEKIYALTKEQRKLLATRDKDKEALQSKLMWINTAGTPGILVLIAIGLGIFRFVRARNYAAHRQED